MVTKSAEQVLELIKRQVIEALGSLPLGQADYEGTAKNIARGMIRQQLALHMTEMPDMKYSYLYDTICDDLFGLGCLEPLLRDDSVTDILVKGIQVVSVSGDTRSNMNRKFGSVNETRRIIDRITGRIGKRVDTSTPFCDCQLYDGSRCHIIIPPASDDIFITIRKLKRLDLSLNDWVTAGVISESGVRILEQAVNKKRNVIISGGTGAGKTTLLNSLANTIEDDQVIVTLEDTYELKIQKPNVRRLLTRQSATDGAGEINFSRLLKNALRMNPDRLIMGEVRDEAAYDLLHALNVGHKGSISTIHANSVMDAMWRLETLAIMAVPNISLVALKRQIARVVDYVVQIQGIERSSKGYSGRRVLEIAAVLDTLSPKGDYKIIKRYACEAP